MAGRPKPTKLKAIEGNRGRRKLKPEPEPRGTVEKPGHLSRTAGAVWDDHAGTLENCGLLTPPDVEVFACLCENLALVRDGTVVIGSNDWHKLVAEIRKLANDFGMTPRGRAGLVVGSAEKDDDPMAAIL